MARTHVDSDQQYEASRPARWWVVELTAVALVLLAGAPLLLGRSYYLDDAQHLFLPLAASMQHAIADGEPLWWSPDLFAGYCTVGAAQNGWFYPVNQLLLRLCPLVLAFRLCYLIHLWLLARGVLGFSLTLGGSLKSAAVAAAVATLGGAVAAHTIHLNILVAMGWTGPILWLAALALRPGPQPLSVMLLGGAIGLSLLQGQPQYVWFAGIAVGCLALTARDADVSLWTAALRLLLAAAMGVALAAAQVLPVVEYASRYPRPHPGGSFSFLTAGSMQPRDWLRLLQPDLFGTPLRGTFPDGAYLYWETRGFFGTAFLVLGLAGALRGRRTSATRLGTALAVVGLFLMAGRTNPVYRLLIHVPLFSTFRVPGRFGWLLQLGVALLAGQCVQALEQGDSRSRRGWVSAVVVGVACLSTFAVAAGSGRLAVFLSSPGTWLMVVGLAAASSALLLGESRPRRAALNVTLAVGVLELVVSWHSFARTVPGEVLTRQPAAAATILASDNRRLLALELPRTLQTPRSVAERLEENVGTLWGLSYFGGQEPLQPTTSLGALQQLADAHAAGQRELFDFLCDRFSIRWIATTAALDHSSFRLAQTSAGRRLYENTDARPLAYAVPMSFVREGGVWTTSDSLASILRVEVLERHRHLWRLRASFDQPVAVVLSQSLYPGWTVTVDGQSAPLMGAESLFMSVALPPGQHVIEFRFDNVAIYLGKSLSLIAFCGWLVALAFVTVRRRHT